MFTSVNNLVSISSELRLKTVMKLYGKQHFKLMSTHEATVLNDFSGIAFLKNSSLTKYFNEV